MQLLVDFSSLLYRAYHSTPDSIPMNGVHGFLNMLARVLEDRRPVELGLCTDDDWRPEFRTRALPSYKAHRVGDLPDPVTPQEAVARELLSAMGLAVVGYPGYEAEDVIASLLSRARQPVEILSGDRDLFALVEDPQVKVLYPTKGTSQLLEVDEAEITRRYGIPGRAYGDFALLRGDPSDGLPGVAGIGEKTASRLIAEHGSLEALLKSENLKESERKKLQAGRSYLETARKVVLPVRDIPLPAVDLKLPDRFTNAGLVREIAEQHRLENAVERAWKAVRNCLVNPVA